MTLQVVGDILKSATIVSADCPIHEAVGLMTADHRDRVYVTNEIGRVSGVACDFTLLKALIRGESSDTAVGPLASPLQDRLAPTQSLEEAAVFFRTGSRTQLPVFENDQFLGIVERTGLLAVLVQSTHLTCLPEAHDDPDDGSSFRTALSGLINQQSMKTG